MPKAQFHLHLHDAASLTLTQAILIYRARGGGNDSAYASVHDVALQSGRAVIETGKTRHAARCLAPSACDRAQSRARRLSVRQRTVCGRRNAGVVAPTATAPYRLPLPRIDPGRMQRCRRASCAGLLGLGNEVDGVGAQGTRQACAREPHVASALLQCRRRWNNLPGQRRYAKRFDDGQDRRVGGRFLPFLLYPPEPPEGSRTPRGWCICLLAANDRTAGRALPATRIGCRRSDIGRIGRITYPLKFVERTSP